MLFTFFCSYDLFFLFIQEGADNGKYDEGNAKGAQNGHGYGVNKDPKACSFKKNKKQCKRWPGLGHCTSA